VDRSRERAKAVATRSEGNIRGGLRPFALCRRRGPGRMRGACVRAPERDEESGEESSMMNVVVSVDVVVCQCGAAALRGRCDGAR
jgi:hypothetical protein